LHLRDRLDRDLDAEAFERVDGAGPRPVDVAVLIVVRTKVAVLLPGGQDVVAGNVSSADDWEALLVPEIDRQQAEHQRVAFRADAAFARPAIYEALEARGVQYAIRIPANNHLELAVEDILFQPPGRPSLKPLIRYKSFSIRRRAGPRPDGSWRKSNTTPASCSRASASS
jgi:Transposase DDE domain group 1